MRKETVKLELNSTGKQHLIIFCTHSERHNKWLKLSLTYLCATIIPVTSLERNVRLWHGQHQHPKETSIDSESHLELPGRAPGDVEQYLHQDPHGAPSQGGCLMEQAITEFHLAEWPCIASSVYLSRAYKASAALTCMPIRIPGAIESLASVYSQALQAKLVGKTETAGRNYQVKKSPVNLSSRWNHLVLTMSQFYQKSIYRRDGNQEEMK